MPDTLAEQPVYLLKKRMRANRRAITDGLRVRAEPRRLSIVFVVGNPALFQAIPVPAFLAILWNPFANPGVRKNAFPFPWPIGCAYKRRLLHKPRYRSTARGANWKSKQNGVCNFRCARHCLSTHNHVCLLSVWPFGVFTVTPAS